MIFGDLTTAMTVLAQQHDGFATYTFIKNPDFQNYLPRIAENAELRIFRDIVPLATREQTSNSKAVFTAGSRILSLSLFSPAPVVVEGIAAITPPNAGSPSSGRRWQYEKTTLDVIDFLWPQENQTMSPQAAWPELFWAPLDDSRIVVAPTPDQAYPVEGTGIFRPTPISAANPSTYLSTVYPDLLLASCMIEVAGFMRDYGQQSDDPKLALSWEQQYNGRRASALEEEKRRRGEAMGGSSLPPAPEMAQPRGIEGGGMPMPGGSRATTVPF